MIIMMKKRRNPVTFSYSDGIYTIDSVTTELYIYISSDSVMPIVYDVQYVLNSSTSSSTTTNIDYRVPFSTTITAENGFYITDVTVRMGGVTLSGVYDSNTGLISIPSVTGDLEIIVSTMSLPIWEDDDYVPIPPVYDVTDDSDSDTTTIVACAAAAVVAALMAVFLIIERKKS